MQYFVIFRAKMAFYLRIAVTSVLGLRLCQMCRPSMPSPRSLMVGITERGRE